MSRIKKVDLVIPVYNEEVNLPRLFDRLRADLASLSCAWRVIFVDDGSHDRSWELISATARQDHMGEGGNEAGCFTAAPHRPHDIHAIYAEHAAIVTQ